MIYMI